MKCLNNKIKKPTMCEAAKVLSRTTVLEPQGRRSVSDKL
jgi:hypothetical protein